MLARCSRSPAAHGLSHSSASPRHMRWHFGHRAGNEFPVAQQKENESTETSAVRTRHRCQGHRAAIPAPDHPATGRAMVSRLVAPVDRRSSAKAAALSTCTAVRRRNASGRIWRRDRTSGGSGSPRWRTRIRHRKTSKAAHCLRAAPEIGLMTSGSATVRSSVQVRETLAVAEHDLAGAREHQNALVVEL